MENRKGFIQQISTKVLKLRLSIEDISIKYILRYDILQQINNVCTTKSRVTHYDNNQVNCTLYALYIFPIYGGKYWF